MNTRICSPLGYSKSRHSSLAKKAQFEKRKYFSKGNSFQKVSNKQGHVLAVVFQ